MPKGGERVGSALLQARLYLAMVRFRDGREASASDPKMVYRGGAATDHELQRLHL
jgi:hypothetical protein